MRGSLLRKLLQAYAEGDHESFEQAARQLASNESEAGHKKLASELKAIIAKLGPRIVQDKRVVDIAEPREDLAGLLQGGHCKERFRDIVLSEEMKKRLQRVISENRRRTDLESWGVQANRKVLFYGPPGCGKTLAARVLAGELGMPVLTVRLDGLFSRYLGATASHLKVIFEEMYERPGVYLFDEFDALGKTREDSLDIGEMRRVVTSFLQLMDADKSHSLIIAATNCGTSLDKALFRRFDIHLYFPLPSTEQIKELIRLEFAVFDVNETTISWCAETAQGMSFAEVTRACRDAIKTMALEKRTQLEEEDVKDAFYHIRDRLFDSSN